MGRIVKWKPLLIVLGISLTLMSAEIIPASAIGFTLALSTTNATLPVGSSVRVLITLTSNGLSGTINVGITSVSPVFGKGISFVQPRYDVWISRTAPVGTALITFSAAQGATLTTYTITITGKDIMSGPGYGLTHTATLTLTVT